MPNDHRPPRWTSPWPKPRHARDPIGEVPVGSGGGRRAHRRGAAQGWQRGRSGERPDGARGDAGKCRAAAAGRPQRAAPGLRHLRHAGALRHVRAGDRLRPAASALLRSRPDPKGGGVEHGATHLRRQPTMPPRGPSGSSAACRKPALRSCCRHFFEARRYFGAADLPRAAGSSTAPVSSSSPPASPRPHALIAACRRPATAALLRRFFEARLP